jgi:hypothetical protein
MFYFHPRTKLISARLFTLFVPMFYVITTWLLCVTVTDIRVSSNTLVLTSYFSVLPEVHFRSAESVQFRSEKKSYKIHCGFNSWHQVTACTLR